MATAGGCIGDVSLLEEVPLYFHEKALLICASTPTTYTKQTCEKIIDFWTGNSFTVLCALQGQCALL